MQKEKKFPFRKILLWLFVAIFVLYVWTHARELDSVIDTLGSGSWRWLFVAAVTQALFYIIYTIMTKWAFKTVDLKRKIEELIPLVFGSIFVNTLAPTAGNSGTILFADDASRRKESATRAVVGYLISTVASYTSFSLVLIFALFYLKNLNLLDRYEVAGAIIFVLPTTIPTFLMIFAMKKRKSMEKFLASVYGLIDKAKRLLKLKIETKKEWAKEVTDELVFAGKSIVLHKKELSVTLLLALSAHIVNIISLFVIFISFDIHVRYGALIAGYAFAEVVRVISPHPEGVGAVEAVMVLLFTSFGVPPIDATAIAITFRGLNFWIPLGIGFLYLQKLKSFSED